MSRYALFSRLLARRKTGAAGAKFPLERFGISRYIDQHYSALPYGYISQTPLHASGFRLEKYFMMGELSLRDLVGILQDDPSVNPARMQDLLERLAVSTGEIQSHARFSDHRYARNLVHKTDRFEVMIMCWHAGQRSSIHDHAGSLGGLKILHGALTESLFEKAPNGMIKSLSSLDYAIGKTRVEETSLIHQLSNLQAENDQAISVHIYAPPLMRMNVYSLEDPSVRNVLPQYFTSGGGI